MSNFRDLLIDILNEKGVSIKDLENQNIVSENLIYKYSHIDPSLKTIINLANFLQVTIDYILNFTNENNFKPYKKDQYNFYKKLKLLMKENNISAEQVARDLKISNSNFGRWRNGTLPSLSKIIDISNYLNCSIDELLDKE